MRCKKSSIFLFTILIISLFLLSCSPEPLTDEELKEEVSKLTPEERQELLADMEAEESGALAGQAIRAKPYARKISPKTFRIPKERITKAVEEVNKEESMDEKGGLCGNGVLESGEQCDDGNTMTETSCKYGEEPTPENEYSCKICTATCKESLLDFNINPKAFSYCGDGIVQGIEECDNGVQNGEVCSSVYDAECGYCTNDCKMEVVQGELKLDFSRSQEVFVGPLVGWKNLKTDYGAVGDGINDDTAALQNALNGLYQDSNVLYIPAGTYKITQTLNFLRDEKGNPADVKIVGEDPEKTKIIWEGSQEGIMFKYNPTYSSMSRLTLDGKGKAAKIIEYAGLFSGWAEFSDMTFQDAGTCLELGVKGTGIGMTDSAILRSKFLRCDNAVLLLSFNTLQWEIWDSYFEDNKIGVSNMAPEDSLGAGNYHVYQSVFKNSKITDTLAGIGGFFTIRDSVSIGSNAFHISSASSATESLTLQRNTIIQTVKTIPPKEFKSICNTPICIGNRGTLMLLDNVISSYDKAVRDVGTSGAFISMGNTYTTDDWFWGQEKDWKGEGSRMRSIDDKIVDKNSIPMPSLALPGTPPKIETDVFEVSPGNNDDTATIQQAIDKAAKSTKKKPVIHLQKGDYFITKTLVIPPNTDLQMIGDGILLKSNLRWVGSGSGPVIRIDGPSQATLREVVINGIDKSAGGVVVSNVEQPGSRIRTNQVLVEKNNINIFVNKLQEPIVEFLSTAIGDGEVGIKVLGSGKNKKNSKVLQMGEGGSVPEVTYDVQDGELIVRDVWTESRHWLSSKYVHLKGQTKFTLHNFFQSHPRDSDPSKTTIIVDGIDGKASFIGGIYSATPGKLAGENKPVPSGESVSPTYVDLDHPQFNSVPSIDVRGTNPYTKVLVAGSYGRGSNFFKSSSNNAKVGQIYTVVDIIQDVETYNTFKTTTLADSGDTSDAFLKEMFEQTRNYGRISYAPTPSGTTDLFFIRMKIYNADTGLLLTPSFCGNNIVEPGESCDSGSSGDQCQYDQTSCIVCSSKCDQKINGQTSFCGDNVCDLKQESTSSCQQDCGNACPSVDMLSWWSGEQSAVDKISSNDGTLHGAAAYSKGMVGDAFSFDGVDSFIETKNTAKFAALTFAAWVNPKLDGYETILGTGKGNSMGYIWFISSSGNGGLHLGGVKAGNNSLAIPYKLAADEWAHIAVTWEKDNGFKAYKNGVEVAKGETKITEATWGGTMNSAFAIGVARSVSPQHFFNGNIDELTIWDRALAQPEIQSIYNAGSLGMCK